ncbi:glycerophosphodiester phosphodiesterase [Nostoc linckia FACHB-104]|nr:glycerophosphodiester phosphodiesterase [Nostoc linckia FACHB-104]
MTDKTLIIAHRGGASIGVVENTIDAFQKAINLGVPMAELDVRRTKDKYLVCHHDQSIGGKYLECLEYAEVLKISNSNGFTVPLLEEVLQLCCGKMNLDIELKEEGYEEDVLSLTKKYFRYSEFVIKSFNYISVTKIKRIDPNVKVGLLLEGEEEEFKRFSIIQKVLEIFPEYKILRSRLDFVSPHYRLLKFGFLIRMRLLKKEVYVWTVNEEKLLKDLFKIKVDAVITDKPDVAMKVLARVSGQSN